MARTDDLARLLSAIQGANAKLVLVGDPQQLGAVGPGGIFSTLVADHGAHELETVRRFHHAWEKAASLRLRAHDPSILSAYLRHDRIEDGSRAEMLDRAFSIWRDARDEGASIVVMAGDNETAEELSRRCRADRVQHGEVAREGVRISTGIASIGDEIVTLRNDRTLRPTAAEFVRNGARWQVVDVTDDGGLRVAPFAGSGSVTLPQAYVAEHVALAYALTIHKAQGATTDRALVLVDERMTAAQLYVAMSRGRMENRALVICSDDAPEDHVRRPSVDAIELLAAAMRRGGTDRSAHDVMREGLSRYENVELLRDLYEEARRANSAAIGRDQTKEIAALEKQAKIAKAAVWLESARDASDRSEQRRREAEVRLAEVEHETVLSRLPGRLGAGARDHLAKTRHDARMDLAGARQREEEILARYEGAVAHLEATTHAAKRLGELHESQTRRERWIREHADELRWERDLRTRLHEREQQLGNARTRGELSDEVDGADYSHTARARDAGRKARVAEQAEDHELAQVEETVVGWRRGADHTAAPEPPYQSPEHSGPVLRL